MKARIPGICTLAALLVFACSGSRSHREADGSSVSPDKEKLIEVLTLFVEAVQGDRFDKAMGYLAPDERAKMTDASGEVPPLVRRRLKAVRLSTLAQKSGVRLERDKLEGIFEWLPVISPGPKTAPSDSIPPLYQ